MYLTFVLHEILLVAPQFELGYLTILCLRKITILELDSAQLLLNDVYRISTKM